MNPGYFAAHLVAIARGTSGVCCACGRLRSRGAVGLYCLCCVGKRERETERRYTHPRNTRRDAATGRFVAMGAA